jgi:hypothetical protein
MRKYCTVEGKYKFIRASTMMIVITKASMNME